MTTTAHLTIAPDFLRPRRALLSVSDKSGLIDLAKKLQQLDIELISTGGSAHALRQAGLDITEVSNLTGFPEIMDGRVKTLHPKIHGGLLAIRDNPDHAQALLSHNIPEIDLLIVNLYPFEQVSATEADFATIIENIDIGGPAMIRAAAKNHGFCTVLTDVREYDALIEELDKNEGKICRSFRRKMAARAFARTACYDAAIAHWFGKQTGDVLPEYYANAGQRQAVMRYGENPHQQAALYLNAQTQKRAGVVSAQIIQGKPLSYNNLVDGDAAFELVSEFNPVAQAAVAIIKHANPCGVGIGNKLADAYRKAYACDQMSAFGGIVALNRELDSETAHEIVKIFTEVIIAPQASDEARSILATKPNLRLLITGHLPDPAAPGHVLRSVAGGFLVQNRDNVTIESCHLQNVTKRAPTPAEMEDLKFAFRVAKHVKSNAIIYAKNGATVGIGAGQMSRLDSAHIAALKAQAIAPNIKAAGCVVASDAFFPFADGLLAAIEAGATAAIQPGGSMRDDEVIACADAHDIAMVFTGSRHFRH